MITDIIKKRIDLLIKIAGIIAILFSTFFFFDSRYTHADTTVSMQLSFEQSQTLMRIDIIEDRIERALRQGNKDKARKLKRQLRRLESRLQMIESKTMTRHQGRVLDY